MNGPGDIPLTLSSTPDTKPCSLVSIIPAIDMSSCRGRAEAFARRLSSKLRTLGSQNDEDEESASQEDEPIINGQLANTWISSTESNQTVTSLQPLRHETNAFFDFDCDLESPGSPVDECEYLRLIETTSNTPHNSVAHSCTSAASSSSSAEGAFLNINNTSNKLISLPSVEAAEATEATEAVESAESAEEFADCVDFKSPTAPSAIVMGRYEIPNCQDQLIDHLDSNEMQNQDLVPTDKQVQLHNDTNSGGSSYQLEPETTDATPRTQTAVSADDCGTKLTNGHHKSELEVMKFKEVEILASLAEVKTDISLPSNAQINGAKTFESSNELKKSFLSSGSEKEAISKSQETLKVSCLDTTDDEDDCRPQRVRRCSSLKTGKTPPGTPGRKKIVRFADVLGLDLADVKTFLDEIPTIPKSAFEDLEVLELEAPLQLGPKSDKLLMPLFQQPGGLSNFLDFVREKQVSLENAAVTDHINQTITGSVRVRNLDFHKSVHIRYTLDGWRSYADLKANYVQNSCDGFSDKFSFTIFGNSLHIGQRLELAVRFQCKGQQFWDNNYGTNYCFQCLPSSAPSSCPIQIQPILPSSHLNHMPSLMSPNAGEAWCHSFY